MKDILGRDLQSGDFVAIISNNKLYYGLVTGNCKIHTFIGDKTFKKSDSVMKITGLDEKEEDLKGALIEQYLGLSQHSGYSVGALFEYNNNKIVYVGGMKTHTYGEKHVYFETLSHIKAGDTVSAEGIYRGKLSLIQTHLSTKRYASTMFAKYLGQVEIKDLEKVGKLL